VNAKSCWARRKLSWRPGGVHGEEAWPAHVVRLPANVVSAVLPILLGCNSLRAGNMLPIARNIADTGLDGSGVLTLGWIESCANSRPPLDVVHATTNIHG
jgi:hypothetical protein